MPQSSNSRACRTGFGIIIPARYGSQRLPGKPLRIIAGKPLIVHVYENALRVNADFTVLATDDERIAEVIGRVGGDVELTASTHLNGTERLAEVVQKRGLAKDPIIVNVQGDEPLLQPGLVRKAASSLMQDSRASLSTLASRLTSVRDAFDPNVVKVVFDREGFALYFSRAPIPWARDAFCASAVMALTPAQLPAMYRHWGIYAYRAETLLALKELPPGPEETAECLEQLRALHFGFKMAVAVVECGPERGVDTEEDLAVVERSLLECGRAAVRESS